MWWRCCVFTVLWGTDSQYRCSTCKGLVDAERRDLFTSLPNVLIFHLNRALWTSRGREKILNQVDFPLTHLDMTPYCEPRSPTMHASSTPHAASSHIPVPPSAAAVAATPTAVAAVPAQVPLPSTVRSRRPSLKGADLAASSAVPALAFVPAPVTPAAPPTASAAHNATVLPPWWSQSPHYRLVAIVSHLGRSMDEGHCMDWGGWVVAC